MVWGSIAREVEAGNIDTVQRFDAGLDEGCEYMQWNPQFLRFLTCRSVVHDCCYP